MLLHPQGAPCLATKRVTVSGRSFIAPSEPLFFFFTFISTFCISPHPLPLQVILVTLGWAVSLALLLYSRWMQLTDPGFSVWGECLLHARYSKVASSRSYLLRFFNDPCCVIFVRVIPLI